MYIEELSRTYRADHFLSYILRSALKTCWNYIGQTVLEFDFGTKDGPFFMLCFKVRSSIIINVRITEGGTISYAVFQDLPLNNLCLNYGGRIISYALFQGPPCY
mgnify:CR=1 FL=1